MSDFSLRRLNPGDASLYRAIRLEGLKLYPKAFASDYEAEFAQPLDWFQTRLASHATFGAFHDDDASLAGTAGLIVPAGSKLRHRGTLVGMYVRDAARGTGVSRALLAHVLAYARTVVEDVTLTVAADNRAALRLYESAGFRVYAREPRELKIGGEYFDSLLMHLRFDAL
jgi:ribosomal protein S18 acetylase RimI-like enzyme